MLTACHLHSSPVLTFVYTVINMHKNSPVEVGYSLPEQAQMSDDVARRYTEGKIILLRSHSVSLFAAVLTLPS